MRIDPGTIFADMIAMVFVIVGAFLFIGALRNSYFGALRNSYFVVHSEFPIKGILDILHEAIEGKKPTSYRVPRGIQGFIILSIGIFALLSAHL